MNKFNSLLLDISNGFDFYSICFVVMALFAFKLFGRYHQKANEIYYILYYPAVINRRIHITGNKKF